MTMRDRIKVEFAERNSGTSANAMFGLITLAGINR